MRVRQHGDAAVLENFIDHALVVLQRVGALRLPDDILLKRHRTADPQNMMTVGILASLDENEAVFCRFGAPEQLALGVGRMVGDGEKAIVHARVALIGAVFSVKERRLFQIVMAVGNHGMGMQIAAQPGALVKIRGLPSHRFASFYCHGSRTLFSAGRSPP